MEKLYVFNVNYNRITGVWTCQLIYANGTGSCAGLVYPVQVRYQASTDVLPTDSPITMRIIKPRAVPRAKEVMSSVDMF